MKQVCGTCHTPDYVNQFYRQYDDLVIHDNEKFAKPGQAIMSALASNNLITKTQYETRAFLAHDRRAPGRHQDRADGDYPRDAHRV